MTDMTTWRYVITRERLEDTDVYAVRELYTDEDGKLSWTADPVAPKGDTWAELYEDLTHMERAAGTDMLDLTLDPPALVRPWRSRHPKPVQR